MCLFHYLTISKAVTNMANQTKEVRSSRISMRFSTKNSGQYSICILIIFQFQSSVCLFPTKRLIIKENISS